MIISPPPLARAMLDAIEEPALLLGDERTIAANAAARQLLGDGIEGKNIRLAIRQPQALATILAARNAELEVFGIGGPDRCWGLLVRPLETGLLLVRLSDRSALRATEKMRVDFVANASHDLRTPLSTIVGYAETLAEDGELSAELRRKFGAAIHVEARRMLRIVEDLMSLSRIEAERFVLPSERLDLGEIVRIAAENGAPLAGRRDCAIETMVEPGLPPITGDFAQLLQLADNLLGNAIRYGCIPEAPTVRIEAVRQGSEALLVVIDEGEGIAAEHIPRLTERFYRVDAARSRDTGGTGLGLAIVKHIVERHRGSISISSAPGRGTRVEVRLPLDLS